MAKRGSHHSSGGQSRRKLVVKGSSENKNFISKPKSPQAKPRDEGKPEVLQKGSKGGGDKPESFSDGRNEGLHVILVSMIVMMAIVLAHEQN